MPLSECCLQDFALLTGKSPDASYSMNSGFGLLSESLKEGAKLAARAVCEVQFLVDALVALVIILLVVYRHTV